jgi:soluble lytic murein transglycosylase-like protein
MKRKGRTVNVIGKIMLGVAVMAPDLALSGDIFSYPRTRMAEFKHQINVIESRGVATYAVQSSETAKISKARPAGELVVAKRKLRGRHISLFIGEAKAIAKRHGIPQALFLALIQQESAWNKNARSSAGAIGLAQLMPGTAKDLGVNPNDPLQNMEGGARYLRDQFDTFGNWRLVLAAYNAGPGAVQKYNGIPPYRETRNYVKRILGS